MSIKKSEFFALIAIVLIGLFLFSLFLAPSALSVFLLAIVLAILISSFFYPRPAFIALIVLRTATDFLTATDIVKIGDWSVNFTSLVGMTVILFALHIFWRQRGEWKKIPLLINWLLFLGLAFILIVFSISPATSLVEFLRWTSFFSLFILGFFLFRGGQQSTVLIKTIIISSLIPMAAALWQFATGQEFFDGERWRVAGTFTHPNMLAFYVVFVATLTIFIFLTLRRDIIQKYFYLLLAIPLISVLILTYTRGAWLAFLLVILLIGIFRFRILLGTTIIVIGLLYLSVPSFQLRVASLSDSLNTGSTVWRLDLWRDAWGYTQDNLILGTGPGTSPLIIGANRPISLGSTEAHNDYIKVVLETGLFGLTLYLALIISLLWNLWRGWITEKWPRRKLLFLFMFIFSLAFYAASIGDNILKDSSLQWSFWALVGALMYSYSQIKNDKKDMIVE